MPPTAAFCLSKLLTFHSMMLKHTPSTPKAAHSKKRKSLNNRSNLFLFNWNNKIWLNLMLRDPNLQKTLHGSGRRTEFACAVVREEPKLSLIGPWREDLPFLHPKEDGTRQVIACPFLHCISLKVHIQMARAACRDLHGPGSNTCSPTLEDDVKFGLWRVS